MTEVLGAMRNKKIEVEGRKIKRNSPKLWIGAVYL